MAATKLTTPNGPSLAKPILTLIGFVYAVVLGTLLYDYAQCARSGSSSCGTQAQSVTQTGFGIATTLWAYISKSPIDEKRSSPKSSSSGTKRTYTRRKTSTSV